MANARIALMVIAVLLTAQVATPPQCLGDEVKCPGKYKGTLTPLSDDELAEILKQHDAWVKEAGADHLDDPKIANHLRRANLCKANLRSAPERRDPDRRGPERCVPGRRIPVPCFL